MGHADLSGAVLDGRYRVIEAIAEGAMGVVYRAERVKLGRIVAVKVLHEELPSELASRKRFEIEATAMAKLEHPHCAAVLDVGVHDERPYVVMDFVSGDNLRELIARGPMPIPRAVEIVRQVLSGLAHAHEHGIIHRDVKPANIMLSQKAGLGDHVKILDFGLARLNDVSNLTTGIVVGTPSYMAPEQIRGSKIDHRADIYACGILLFELLTAHKPFHSEKDDPVEVCSMHLKQPPPKLADKLPGIEFGPLEAVVARALAKNPADRFDTAEEFAAALDEFVPRMRTATPISGVPITPHAATPGALFPSAIPAEPPVATPSGWSLPADAVVAKSAEPAIAKPAEPMIDKPIDKKQPSTTPGTPAAPARAAVATPASAQPSLAPGFDLSLAIPQATDVVVTDASIQMPDTIPSGPPPAAAHDTEVRNPTVAFLGAPPAGPSPLSIRDAAPVPPPAFVPPPDAPGARSLPLTKRQLVIGGASVLGLVVVIAIIASATGGKRSTTAPDSKPVAPAQHAGNDRADAQLARAADLVSAGKTDEAIDLLVATRKVFPEDARIAYEAGKLYFGRMYWSAGLKQFRDAIKLEPAYKSDPELIKTVLRGFLLDEDYNPAIAGFLRNDIGPAAKPFLEETAQTHPKQYLRERAASELRRYP
ncbi:MAG TPA: protein kinase [Kofleriaceae bacterium]|nr:protein kinase [Kofleriaceae bacterium]